MNREALDSCRRTRDAGQHQVDDVLAQLVVASGDPHLVPEEPVAAAVRLRFRLGRNVGQRRAGLRLGQAHGPEEPTLDHGMNVGLDLLREPWATSRFAFAMVRNR